MKRCSIVTLGLVKRLLTLLRYSHQLYLATCKTRDPSLYLNTSCNLSLEELNRNVVALSIEGKNLI